MRAGDDALPNRGAVTIYLTYRGTSGCVLPAATDVARMAQADGTLVSFAPAHAGSSTPVEPGQVAVYQVSTAASCPASMSPNRKDIVVTSFNLRLGGNVVFPISGVSLNVLCGDVQAGQPLVAGTATSATADDATTRADSVAKNLPLTVSLQGPANVQAASSVLYEVTLTNTSSSVYSFDPCPSYTEDMVGVIASRFSLNCGALPPALPAGSSVTLQMKLAVPAGAPAGSTKFSWFLDNDGGTAVAHTTVGG